MNVETSKYGADRETTLVDDHGSTQTVVTNIVKGSPSKPRRIVSERRFPTDDIDIQTLGTLLKDMVEDPQKFDVAVRVEPGGHKARAKYYIVACYTTLQY